MALLSTVLSAVAFGAFLVLGVLGHEGGHWLLGRLFGGRPYVDRYTLGLPTRINFRYATRMTDWQVRAIGAWPYAFIPVLLGGFWLESAAVMLVGTGGAITISPSDMTALWYPDRWKRLTARAQSGRWVGNRP